MTASGSTYHSSRFHDTAADNHSRSQSRSCSGSGSHSGNRSRSGRLSGSRSPSHSRSHSPSVSRSHTRGRSCHSHTARHRHHNPSRRSLRILQGSSISGVQILDPQEESSSDEDNQATDQVYKFVAEHLLEFKGCSSPETH